MRKRPGRGWMAFSLIGIGLWVGAVVLVGALNEEPTDPAPTLIAFVAGGVLFFGAMFGVALWQQLRRRAESGEARFGKRVAVGYSITGAVVTGLGLAAVWRGGVQDEDAGLFLYPMIAIVAVWAVAALLILGRYSR